MNRFFVELSEFQPGEIHFSQETSRQITRVLRLKPGESVIVLDNAGNEFLSKLDQVKDKACIARIVKKDVCTTEPRIQLTMMLCLTQREKFEWMLQKCTEIGVTTFLPVISSRSLVQHVDDFPTKYTRWKRIIKEAAEQSGRGIIPELLPSSRFEEALKIESKNNDACLIPWEGELQTSLKGFLRKREVKKIALLIGPEGGFSEEEVKLSRKWDFTAVTLGPRILRMETAAVVAAAMVFYELESN